MKKTITLLLIAFALCCLNSCWHQTIHQPITLAGYSEQMTVPVMEFTQISVRNAISIEFCDTISEIQVTADANLIDRLIVKQIGKELDIHYPNGTHWNGDCVTHVLIPTQQNINDISLSGAAEIALNRPISGENVKINLTGASQLHGQLDCNRVKIHLSGASTAYLSGNAARMEAEISGASTLHSEKDEETGNYLLDINTLYGNITGASELFMHSDGSLNCSLTGASTIFLTGNADISGCIISGASHIIGQ